MHWVWGVLLSDILTFFSFPPFPLGPVMLVGLIPLFVALERAQSWRSAFLRAWVYVFVGNSAICFWVGPTIQEFARVSAWVSYPSVAVLSLFEQSAWPVMAALRFILHRKMGIRPLLWSPACLMMLDAAWPKFFPNSLGNVFYSVPWLSQFADVAGVWGLTALIVVTNEIGALWYLKWRASRIVRASRGETNPAGDVSAADLSRHSIAAAVVVAGVFAYSTWRYHDIRLVQPTDKVRIALVQPNINPVALVRAADDKHVARYRNAVSVIEMSREVAKQKPELIFWPETAVSNPYRSQDRTETVAVTQAIDDFVRETGVPLLFGARDKQGVDLYNALFLVSPNQGILEVDRYYKNRLLWIGEYIPLSTTFPSIAQHIRDAGGTPFTPGKGPMVFPWTRASGANVLLGPMICLEGLYSGYVRDIALAGANVLVNATNDAWFGQGMEPALHLYLTAFRAIETRRPLVRSTTTGHSAVIDIDGTMRLKTALGEKGAFVEDVPLYAGLTSPYMAWGLLPVWLALAWTVWGLGVGYRRKK